MKKLNNYESVIIIKNTTKEEYKTILNKIMKRINKIVNVKEMEELGIKRLAYEINKNKQGFYVILYFKARNQEILELERFYRITDDIIKFITVRKDG